MRNFRKLEVWEQSIGLVKECYDLIKGLPKEEEYGLKQQIRRCAV